MSSLDNGTIKRGVRMLKEKYGGGESGELAYSVAKILDFLIQDVPLDDLPNADGLFVLGHVFPGVAMHAANVWYSGKTSFSSIIVSGMEAHYYSEILLAEGIPEEKIILECSEKEITGKVLFGLIQGEREDFCPESLILCAHGPLLRRSIAAFNGQCPEIPVYGTAPYLRIDDILKGRDYVRGILDELIRLKKYSREGGIANVDIPPEIENAANRVRKILNIKEKKY